MGLIRASVEQAVRGQAGMRGAVDSHNRVHRGYPWRVLASTLMTWPPFVLPACVQDDADSGAVLADTGGDSGESTDDTLPPAIADAFLNEDSGPLGPLILPKPVTDVPRWEVRMATSPDCEAWTASDTVIAWALSSLSGIVLGDVIVLNANIDMSKALRLGVPDPLSAVPILVTRDLTTWNSAELPITETASDYITDSSLWVDGNDALHAVYFSAVDGSGDPAGQQGPHDIDDAVWTDDTLVEAPEPIFSAEGLADPIVARTGDHWTLFTTESANAVTLATSTDGVSFTANAQVWSTVSVPSAWAGEDGSVNLVAQHIDGHDAPDRARVGADGVLEVQDPLYDAHPWGDNCTSPVVLPWNDGFVLFCAVRVIR